MTGAPGGTRTPVPVAINGRFLTQPVTGVQRAAIETLRALDRRLEQEPALRRRWAFRLLAPPTGVRSLELRHIPTTAVGRRSGHRWEQLDLPAHARGDLLLNFCNTAPLRGRVVVSIHDASVFAVPGAYTLPFRLWYQTLLPLLGRRARRVVTDSEFSRGELARWARIPETRTTVVHLGGEHILEASADRGVFGRLGLDGRPYVLAVSSRSPHKNFSGIARAAEHPELADVAFVAAGGGNARVFHRASDATSGRFHAAGYVTDGELRALYEGALCFVYPSFYEGFGLPPLEAMVCGCPVLVSRAASLPEVCGDAALYCDPHDPADIARGIAALVGDASLRATLTDRGRAHARGFTWDAAAGRFLDLIAELEAA
jgi:glycosyltransferase involved in cell wall biosynthesis